MLLSYFFNIIFLICENKIYNTNDYNKIAEYSMLYGGKHCIMIDKDKTNIIITENIGNIKSFQVYILIMKKQGIDKEK